jgi:Cdc6-like AAA superfamily ATPase
MRKIIYGPPGTGKTYYLMNELEKFLEKVDPSKIGYFTFSKNAAQVLLEIKGYHRWNYIIVTVIIII